MQDEKGEAVAKEIGGVFAHANVADTDEVIAAVEAAKELGPLRALVNAAGIGWATRTIGKDGQYASAHDLDMFKKVIEINLIGTFNCIRLAATAMSPERAARRTTSGAPSSTSPRSPPSTARSARPPTRRRRAASSA